MEQAHQLQLSLDSRLEEIARLAEMVEAFCAARGLPAQCAFQFNLCFDEILTNIVLHGLKGRPGHRIDVRLTLAEGQLKAEVADPGPAFNPLDRSPPDTVADLDERDIGGLGIHLVRTMMHEVGYSRTDDRNHFTFGRPLAGTTELLETE